MYPLNAALVVANGKLGDELQQCLRDLRIRVILEQPAVPRWSDFLLQLGRLRPDVLFLDLTGRRESLEETVRRIRTVSSAPVIIVHDSIEPETILNAIRAGAREYLYPPLRQGLEKALERISEEQSKQQIATGSNGKALGVFSAKGGCGATTIACHLAAALQRVVQKEILLSDLDLNTGLIGFLMKAQGAYSIADAAQNVHRLDLSYWKALVTNSQPRLDVIASPRAAMWNQTADPEPYRAVLRFARSNYDWIIADLGRGLSPFALGLVEELDEVFLISNLEVPALYQSKNIVQKLRDLGLNEDRIRLVLNRVPKQSEFTTAEVEKLLGIPIYARLPNSYPELYEAYAEGRLLSPETHLGRQISRLAATVAGIKEEKTGRTFSLFGVKKVAPGLEGV